ncbi:MAG: hypothetical protein KME12_26795 [Trichocoleus desertorum ATA4-8-CV12]|nr:hypothetical protein [Trichocoleus desertorum ATA4-8-CV12]
MEDLDKPFSEINPYKFIRSRETMNEEDYKISEWDVCVDEVKVLLD